MSELVEHITDARNNGTINVYAVRYNQREKTDNVAVALPGNLNFDFRHDFCENIIQYEDAQEVAFNPTSNGLEDNLLRSFSQGVSIFLSASILESAAVRAD